MRQNKFISDSKTEILNTYPVFFPHGVKRIYHPLVESEGFQIDVKED